MHLKAVIFNKVKDLIKLEAGPNHFLAVKQTIRPKFEQWSSDKVSEWVTTICYAEQEKIIKYSKVSGSTLLQNLNVAYLSDTLGILGEVEGFKFITEVKKVKEA